MSPPEIVDDERMGLPSASGLQRLMQCPGSFNAEKALPGYNSKSAERSADLGNKIHEVMCEKRMFVSLGFHEKICCNRLQAEEGRLICDHDFESPDELHREERLWFHVCVDGVNKDRIFSGKPDAVFLKDKRALNVNYKTGRYLPHPIESNWQMIGEALLIVANYPQVETVIGALIHPNVRTDHGDISQTRVYTRKELLFQYGPELVVACVEATKEQTLFFAGDECRFCRCATQNTCQTYQQHDIQY